MTTVDPDPPTPRRHRHWARRAAAAVVAVVAAALAVTGMAVARANSPEASGYRAATAATREVAQTLGGVGTVEPTSQATVSFPVSGTVATVSVATGDDVTTGQALATLDTTHLAAAQREAVAQLDQAELTLEHALDGESVAPSGSTGAQIEPVSLTTESTDAIATFVSPVVLGASHGDDALRSAQEAVLRAQAAVDEARNRSQQSLDTARSVCEAVGADDDDTDDSNGSTIDVDACADALGTALDAQKAVADAQAVLADAMSDLEALLSDRADDTPTTPETPTTEGTPRGPSTDQPSTTPDQPSQSTTTPSAEDLVTYQKKVDSARAAVAVADQALAQATVVSPIDGTVTSVDLAVGDEVEAASTDTTIVVVGPGGYEVTLLVTVDDLPDIEVGQAATVTPDGTSRSIQGQVVRIGTMSDNSGTTTSYPVVIAVTDDEGLRNGATASVAIVTDEATDALTVPTSAITPDDGRHTVTVLHDGATRQVTVEIGAVGNTYTEIRSGLDEGQIVVLADRDEPLPGSATEDNGTTTGFPGAGGGRGGLVVPRR